MYTMSKLRKQALIRIVICVIMLAATIVFSFLLITGKLDGTSSSASSNADSLFAEGEQPSYTTTADASMNLRAGPGTDFDKVTSVPAGTAVTALGTNSDGSWVVVQVGGQYGWLKVEFLNQ